MIVEKNNIGERPPKTRIVKVSGTIHAMQLFFLWDYVESLGHRIWILTF